MYPIHFNSLTSFNKRFRHVESFNFTSSFRVEAVIASYEEAYNQRISRFVPAKPL